MPPKFLDGILERDFYFKAAPVFPCFIVMEAFTQAPCGDLFDSSIVPPCF